MTETENVTYVYSANEIDGPWYEDLDSAIDDAIDAMYCKRPLGTSVVIYRGRQTPRMHADFIFNVSDAVIEKIQDNLSKEIAFDIGEDYLEELDKIEQSEAFEKAILDFLNKNCAQPGFFIVEDVEEVAVDEEGNVIVTQP